MDRIDFCIDVVLCVLFCPKKKKQEVELLRQEKLEIDQQLRAIQGTSMNTMQNFTVQRRSDRGYSSDIDTMRSNRGGSGAGNSLGPGNAGSSGISNAGGGSLRGRGGRGRANNPRFHPGNNLHNSNEPSNYNDSHSDQTIHRPKYNNNPSSRGRGNARPSRGGGFSNGPSNDRHSVRPPVSTTPK